MVLDLQAVFEKAYEAGSYADRIHYDQPCVPSLGRTIKPGPTNASPRRTTARILLLSSLQYSGTVVRGSPRPPTFSLKLEPAVFGSFS